MRCGQLRLKKQQPYTPPLETSAISAAATRLALIRRAPVKRPVKASGYAGRYGVSKKQSSGALPPPLDPPVRDWLASSTGWQCTRRTSRGTKLRATGCRT
ncbi:hypothetical protein DIPPA_33750 [Diplonema papillatum]|nr:hypothetical protein DIPPA_33750 [Diplonema papillatum]